MEDNNKLFEYIKNAPNEIKNALIGILLNTSIGLANVENSLLKNNDETGNTGNKIQINNIKNNLLATMKRGEMNEEYVQYYYKILEKAEDFMNTTSSSDIKLALEKNGMLLTENGNNADIHRYLNNKNDYNKTEHKLSNNTIEVSLKNNVYLIDQYNTNSTPDSYDSTIKCNTSTNVLNRIELYTDTLKVEVLPNNGRILNFYVPIKYPVDQMTNDFNKIKQVSFTTNIGKKYSYNIKFIKNIKKEINYTIISFEGYLNKV